MTQEKLNEAYKISQEIKLLDDLIGHLTIHKILPVAVTVKVSTFLPLVLFSGFGKTLKMKGDETELLLPKSIADKLLPMCVERRDELKKELENL